MVYVILHNHYPAKTATARDVCDETNAHAYHDAKRLDGAYIKGGAASLFGSIALGGAVAAQTHSPEMAVQSVTLFNLAISAYLLRAVQEARGKLSYFRDYYNKSTETFSERDTKLTSRFKDRLFETQPSLSQYVKSIKKYPFTSLAAIGGAALTLATRNPALGSFMMSMFMVTLAAEESCAMDTLAKRAGRARRMIEVSNKVGSLDLLQKSSDFDGGAMVPIRVII